MPTNWSSRQLIPIVGVLWEHVIWVGFLKGIQFVLSEISLWHESKLGESRDLGDALQNCTCQCDCTMKWTFSDLQYSGSCCQYLAGDHGGLVRLLRLLISILMVMGSCTDGKVRRSEGACLFWNLVAHGWIGVYQRRPSDVKQCVSCLK